ncbi:MAG: DUF86 domain-containing protein [Methanothrix sp.]|nr:MAG: DUF86 domain-containing protein [Methanothrix sp.]
MVTYFLLIRVNSRFYPQILTIWPRSTTILLFYYWRFWRGVRNGKDKLIHDYLGVDIDAVWDTVEKDIPALKKKLK